MLAFCSLLFALCFEVEIYSLHSLFGVDLHARHFGAELRAKLALKTDRSVLNANLALRSAPWRSTSELHASCIRVMASNLGARHQMAYSSAQKLAQRSTPNSEWRLRPFFGVDLNASTCIALNSAQCTEPLTCIALSSAQCTSVALN